MMPSWTRLVASFTKISGIYLPLLQLKRTSAWLKSKILVLLAYFSIIPLHYYPIYFPFFVPNLFYLLTKYFTSISLSWFIFSIICHKVCSYAICYFFCIVVYGLTLALSDTLNCFFSFHVKHNLAERVLLFTIFSCRFGLWSRVLKSDARVWYDMSILITYSFF